jgi:hypothetical protein
MWCLLNHIESPSSSSGPKHQGNKLLIGQQQAFIKSCIAFFVCVVLVLQSQVIIA